MITLITNQLKSSSLILSVYIKQSFNYVLLITLIATLYYYSNIKNELFSQIEQSSLRSLIEEKNDGVIDNNIKTKTISNQTKWRIVHNLMRETYIGTWTYQSNNTYTNFTYNQGKMQIVFRLLRSSTRNLHDFYYTYDMIIFDGEYNDHTLIMSSSIPLSFQEDIPSMIFDNKNQTITISNEILSIFNEYRFLSIKQEHEYQSNLTMSYSSNETGYNIRKDLNGTISFNDIRIKFTLEKHRPTFYHSISSFCCWLSVIGLIQAFYSKYQIKLFTQSPEEALKYSPYTFVVNFLYNGSIAFECLLASMLDQTLFYSFIIPSMLYFVNFCFLELKVIVITWNIHDNHSRREMSARMATIKSRLVLFFILFYLLLICLFIYSFDLFFWKSIAYFVVMMTFIPQIIYGFKRKQSGSIIYLLIISLNKLYIPIYFRVKDNFLHFKQDNMFIIAISSIIFTEIVIVIIEKYFRLPNCYRNKQVDPRNEQVIKQKNRNKYYVTIEQLKKKGIEVDSVNCSICLSSLNSLTKEKENNTAIDIEIAQENLESQGKNNTKDKVKLNDKNEPTSKNNCFKRLCKCCNKIKNKKEQPVMLMVTKCKHVFHIECLELWLKRQNSCPQCRTEIPLMQ